MEHKKAHQFLLRSAKKNSFHSLVDYLESAQPIEISQTKMSLVNYLTSVVVSQQLSTKAAKKIWLRVKAVLDESRTKVETLHDELRSSGLSNSKAMYVIGLHQNQALVGLTRSKIKKMPYDKFDELLMSNKGIGPWSVHMTKIFYLGDPDVFPLNDLGIKHAHQKLFNGHAMEENFYEVFRPWRTYLSLYMWRSLN